MKRRATKLAALLWALALLAGLALGIPAAADEITVYQIALNDRLKAISSEFTPVVSGGSYYVPYTIFDKNVTEVDLGISYGQVKRDGVHTLTLYTMSTTLVFDVIGGTCTNNQEESVDLKAIVRNGRVYVPLNVYQYFSGLKCSFTPTSYGTLIRITNGQEGLGTARFVESATSLMRSQYNKYLESINVQPPAVTPAPTSSIPSVTPTPPTATGDPNRQEVQVYLAFRCEAGGDPQAILDRLEGSGVYALFFLRPEALAQNADAVRRMVGSGHSVGLLVEGGTAAELTEALEAGNAMLERVARLRTHAFLVEGSAAGTEALKAEGWALWSGNVDGLSAGRGQTALARSVLDAVAAKRTVARVTMDDSAVSAGALNRILTQLRADRYSIRLAVETEL